MAADAAATSHNHLYRSFLFPLLPILLISRPNGSTANDHKRTCPAVRCNISGANITYPFWTKAQPRSCGHRGGFEIFCQGSQAVLRLNSSEDFYVSEIRYSSRTVIVSDPHQCLHRRILNGGLNLSMSPFYLPPNSTRNATYLNCSEELKGNDTRLFKQVDCLNGPGISSYVYMVNSSMLMSENPSNRCQTINTFPLSTDYYQYDPIFGQHIYDDSPHADDRLYLMWNRVKEDYGSKKKRNEIFTGISIGAGIIILISVTLTYYVCRAPNDVDGSRTSTREERLKIDEILKDYKSHMLARHSYASVKRMTSKFKFQIGKGGYGTVYRGNLSNGTPVAVKMLQNSMGNGQEFINEIATIGRIHHVNLVRLLGFCVQGSKKKPALIYEFMPNESLDKFMVPFSGSEGPKARHELLGGWMKLQEIAIGIGRGIEYLHHGCNQRILHLDIKPHNILLDHNFNPKISDFGLARICSKEEYCNNDNNRGRMSTRGTMGYMAPEVFSRTFGVVSHKSDVYSFGMLVLEMVWGRKDTTPDHDPTVEIMQGRQAHFLEWIYDRVAKGKEGEDENEVARKLTIVALWCIQWNPKNRPSMKRVVQMLQGGLECLEIPPMPFVSSFHLQS